MLTLLHLLKKNAQAKEIESVNVTCFPPCRYQLAENIDAQLKRMVQDLKEIIDHLNTTNTSQDNADPVSSK